MFIILQRLNAGDEPSTAFILSSEAAIAGAESTKHMLAQVTIDNYSLFFQQYLLNTLEDVTGFILALFPIHNTCLPKFSWWHMANVLQKVFENLYW